MKFVWKRGLPSAEIGFQASLCSTEPPEINIITATPPGRLVRVGRAVSDAMGDGLMAFICYSVFFLSIFNSGTNAMQFGREILLAKQAGTSTNGTSTNGTSTNGTSAPDTTAPGTPAPEIDRDVARFIGVVALSILCGLQWASPAAGRRLNTVWAVVKIAFVLVLIGVGGVATSRRATPAVRWAEWADSHNREASAYVWAKALLAVLFNFEGWENATFVAGEIPEHSHFKLRRGFMWAVFAVGFLYLSVAAVFPDAALWADFKDPDRDDDYAALLSGNSVTAKQAWAVVATISSLGSLNSIIYTFSRVKQSIGLADVLPWSKVWKKDHVVGRDAEGTVLVTSPQGELLLHWIMTCLIIVCVSPVDGLMESITLPGNIQTYTHAFILMILASLFYLLPSREAALESDLPPGIFRFSQGGVFRLFFAPVVVLYVLLNLAILVCVVPTHTVVDRNAAPLPGTVFPAVLFGLLGIGVACYLGVFGFATRRYRYDGGVPDEVRPGPLSRWPGLTLLAAAGVRAEVVKDETYDASLHRVHRFGRRWRLRYLLRRDLKHRTARGRGDGLYGGDYGVGAPWNFLYWFFGGSRWLNLTPWERVIECWPTSFKGWLALLRRRGRGAGPPA